MDIKKIPFLVNVKNTYSKAFGIAKTNLKEEGYSKPGTSEIVKAFIVKENVAAVIKNITPDTIFLSTPSVIRGNSKNAIPSGYGEYLSSISNKPHIDINKYVNYKNSKSNRDAYTAKQRAENLFSYQFKDSKKLAEFSKLIKDKDIVIVDDVITTGETIVHLGNYLKNKFPEVKILGGTALLSNGVRKPSTRDEWRFAEKISNLTKDQMPIEELHKLVGKHFGPYTRLKMTRFERGINSPERAYAAIGLMQIDNTRIIKSLSKSIEHKEKFPNRDDIER